MNVYCVQKRSCFEHVKWLVACTLIILRAKGYLECAKWLLVRVLTILYAKRSCFEHAKCLVARL